MRHIAGEVVGIEPGESGDVAALRLRDGTSIAGDLFLDCSGSAALLIDGHCGSGWIDRSDASPNDRALAVQVPVLPGSAIASATVATAHEAGWLWDIGLPDRRGIGCVYASGFMSDERADEILRELYRAQGAWRGHGRIAYTTPPRSLPPGTAKSFWQRQCPRARPGGGFHRAARSLGHRDGRAVAARAGREFSRQPRRDGDPRAPVRRAVPLSLGPDHRFPQAALCAEPPRGALLAGAARAGHLLARARRPARAVGRSAAVGVGPAAGRRGLLRREPGLCAVWYELGFAGGVGRHVRSAHTACRSGRRARGRWRLRCPPIAFISTPRRRRPPDPRTIDTR